MRGFGVAVGSGAGVSSGAAVSVGAAVGAGVATAPLALAETSATTIFVPAGKSSTSDVSVRVRPAPRRLTTTVPPSNSYVFSLRTAPISPVSDDEIADAAGVADAAFRC